jgi:hypothetical protein
MRMATRFRRGMQHRKSFRSIAQLRLLIAQIGDCEIALIAHAVSDRALQGFSWQLSNGKRSNFAQKNMIRMR